MNSEIVFIHTCLSLIGFWALWHYGFRPVILDWARQALFELRDELYDAALERRYGLDFSNPAYRETRASLNAAIRYVHQFTLLESFFSMSLDEQQVSDDSLTWTMISMKAPNEDAKTYLRDVHRETIKRLLDYMIMSAFPGNLMVLAIRSVRLVSSRFGHLPAACRAFIYRKFATRLKGLQETFEAEQRGYVSNQKRGPDAADALPETV